MTEITVTVLEAVAYLSASFIWGCFWTFMMAREAFRRQEE